MPSVYRAISLFDSRGRCAFTARRHTESRIATASSAKHLSALAIILSHAADFAEIEIAVSRRYQLGKKSPSSSIRLREPPMISRRSRLNASRPLPDFAGKPSLDGAD